MKHLIIIIAMASGLAHGQGALPLPPLHKTTVTNTVIIPDHIIKALIDNGYVCRVRGKHEWLSGPSFTLEYRPDGNYPQHRICDLCGRKETKQEVWKEDGQ